MIAYTAKVKDSQVQKPRLDGKGTCLGDEYTMLSADKDGNIHISPEDIDTIVERVVERLKK